MLLFSILVLIPVIMADYLSKNYKHAIFNKPFIRSFGTYINGFSINADILNLMYYPIFLFRRLCFSATIVIFVNYPYLQLILISLGNIVVSIFVS